MAQVTDSEALEPNAKHGTRSVSARTQCLAGPVAFNQHLHREILALMPRLTRYARVLTRDVIAAEDLVQDCLARALEKIHLWEPETDLRAWLFTILRRQHIDHTRGNARRRDYIASQEYDLSLAPSPNRTARLELRDLERALAKLPEKQRSVILLVGLQGMDYAEAAAVVNTPVATVRSRIARGRQTLRMTTGPSPARHPDAPERGQIWAVRAARPPLGTISRLSLTRRHRRRNHGGPSNEIVTLGRLSIPRVKRPLPPSNAVLPRI